MSCPSSPTSSSSLSQLRLTRIATLRAHTAPVWSVSWSPTGLLASCGADRRVFIWSKSPQTHQWTLIASSPTTAFFRAVRQLSWSADARTVAVASFDASVTILELVPGPEPKLDPVVCLEGHDAEVKGVAYSSSSALLATCSRDRSVWIWEVGLDFDYECVAVLNSHRADVKSVVWHPKVEMLLSSSFDNTIRVWVEDADDWFCAEELVAHSSTVWDVCFDSSGDAIASVSADASLVVWRRETPPPSVIGAHPRFVVVSRIPNLTTQPLYSVSWCPNRQLLAVAGGDDAIRLIAPQKPDPLFASDEEQHRSETESQPSPTPTLPEKWGVAFTEHRAHSGDVNTVRWNPHDSNLLASCGDDGLVRIWELEHLPDPSLRPPS